MGAAETMTRLQETGTVVPISERQARALGAVDDDLRPAVMRGNGTQRRHNEPREARSGRVSSRGSDAASSDQNGWMGVNPQSNL